MGAIRCWKHMQYMEATETHAGATALESDHCECVVAIPTSVYKNIMQGLNFTYVFTDSAEEMKTFKREHDDLLRAVGHSETKTDYGMWHIVF